MLFRRSEIVACREAVIASTPNLKQSAWPNCWMLVRAKGSEHAMLH